MLASKSHLLQMRVKPPGEFNFRFLFLRKSGKSRWVSYCLQWFNEFFFHCSETSSESPPPPGGHPSTTPAPSVAHEPNPLNPSEIGSSGGHNLVEKVDSKTLPFARQTRRELPRIATNGTLGRPQPHQQHTVLTQLGLNVTIMCRNDELSSTMSWGGSLLTD